MAPNRNPRRALLGLLAAALLAGCGLPEYEARLRSEQEYLERFDEEMKVLDEPLEAPKRKEGKETVQDLIFLRPPKGIGKTAQEATLGPVSRYVRSNPTCPFTEMYLATAPSDQKDFGTAVVNALAVQLGKPEQRRVAKTLFRRDPQPFDLYENAPAGFALYLGQRGGLQVAIGYQLDKGRTFASVSKQVDLSLESLGTAKEGSVMHKDWANVKTYRRAAKGQ